MRLLILAITSAATFSLCACGSNNASDANTTKSPPAVQETADPYFDAFVSTHTGSCERRDAVFSELNSDPVYLRKDEHGRDILVSLFVDLGENHSFEARYVEYHVTEYLNESKTDFYHSSIYDQYLLVKGGWSTSGDEIVLEKLGTGIKATYNEQKAIALRFANPIISPEGPGATVFLRKGWSKWDFVRDSDPCMNAGGGD